MRNLFKFSSVALAASLAVGNVAFAEGTVIGQHCLKEFKGGSSHVIGSMSGFKKDFVYQADTLGSLVEYSDGTAAFSGVVMEMNNSTTPLNGGQNLFEIKMTLGGRTTTPPSKPKSKCAKTGSNCVYYPTYLSAQLIGKGAYEGAVLELTPRGPAFQLGVGGNTKNGNMGISSWYNYTTVSQPNSGKTFPSKGRGDFNIDVVGCPKSCLVYALHDDSLNDSQFFTIDPEDQFAINALGGLYQDYDIEGLDIHPVTQDLYASSGDDPASGRPNGFLYQVNKETGSITEIGSTGYGEVSALAFRPSDNTLWGWADREGIIIIELADGVVQNVTPEEAFPETAIEDITWNLDGTLLYGVAGGELYAYDPQTKLATLQCTLPSEAEALEMLSNGSILFGLHVQTDLNMYELDVNSCTVQAEVLVKTPYYDLEGIAWPCKFQ